MHLSHQKLPSKPIKSQLPVFGKVTRSPRSPASSSLYSDSFEDTTKESNKHDKGHISRRSQDFKHEDTETIRTENYKENGVTETIHTEILKESGVSETIQTEIVKDGGVTQTIETEIFKDGGLSETIHTEILKDVGVSETIQTEIFKNDGNTDTIHTEIPVLGRSMGERTARSVITENIDPFISENVDSENIVTVTERLPSLAEDSNLSQYSNTFESVSKTGHDSKVVERSKADYSDNYDASYQSSTELTGSLGHSHSPSSERRFEEETITGSSTGSKFLEETVTASSAEITFEEETVESHSQTKDEDYSMSFERESDSHREYSVDFEEESADEYHYSDTFLPTESQDDTLKMQQREEVKRISEEAQGNFVAAMISHIRQKPIRDTDISELIDRELEGYEDLDKNTKRYIQKKIKLMKHKLKYGELKSRNDEVNKWAKDGKQKITDYGINPVIIDKLKMKNFIHDMRKASQMKIHDPKKCMECRSHEQAIDAAAAERNFVRIKTRDVRQRTMEDHYHQHLVKMDSINLIADIARSLPKPTEDPEIIEDQLFKGLALSKSVTKNRIQNNGLDCS